MKTLTTFILAGALALLAQPNQLDLRQDPPTAVQSNRVSSAYTGTAGATTYYYWVVTRYPIGFIVPTAPVIVGGASALGGGNSVALGWPAMTGASSYDVLRTTTNAAPSSCTCAVVLATTGTTLTDNGGALSAWPPGGLNSAGVAQAELQINNRDAGAPYITMAVRNAQRTLNYQLGVLKNGTTPSYVPSGFIQPYSNAQGAMSCVDSTGADCMATRPGPTNYCADVGAVNAYACSLSPAITEYVVGNSYRFKAATANTGPPTVNFNGLGAVAIKTASGADPATGDIRTGQMVDVVYTAGSVMQMQSAPGNSGIITTNVIDFGAIGNDSTNNDAAFSAAIAALPEAGCLYIPPGVYRYNTPLTLPRCMSATPKTVLKYAGVPTSYAARVQYSHGNSYTAFVIDGNGNATYGIDFQSVIGATVTEVRVTNVSGAGFFCNYCQTVLFTGVTVSGNFEAFTTVPVNGIVITGNSGNNTILSPHFEGVSGAGISIQNSGNNVFVNGTSEGNAIGIECLGGTDQTCNHNVFIGVDVEVNSTADVVISGPAATDNTFLGLQSFSVEGVKINGGKNNAFIGGTTPKMTIAVDASFSRVRDMVISGLTGCPVDNGYYSELSGVYDNDSGTRCASVVASPAYFRGLTGVGTRAVCADQYGLLVVCP